MRLNLSSVAVVATLALSSLAAHADTYNFVISTGSTSTTPGSTFSVVGTLTGTPDPTNPGALELTDVTGSGQGYNFSSVIPTGSNQSFTYDNLLFTASNAMHVDSEGVLLSLTSPIGTSLAHVYDNAGNYEVDVLDPNDPGDVTPFAIDTFTLSPTAVPEPSTFLLLGTGLLGAAGAFSRRTRRS